MMIYIRYAGMIDERSQCDVRSYMYDCTNNILPISSHEIQSWREFGHLEYLLSVEQGHRRR